VEIDSDIINEITYHKTGKHMTSLGVFIGVVAGVAVGYSAGSAESDDFELWSPRAGPALTGALMGGLIGGVLGYAIGPGTDAKVTLKCW